MTNIEKLEAWFQREKAEHGLVDFRIVPGSNPNASIEDVAGEVLASTQDELPSKDVTDQTL